MKTLAYALKMVTLFTFSIEKPQSIIQEIACFIGYFQEIGVAD